MSVAVLSARELGLFVALQIKSGLCQPSQLNEAISLALLMHQGNAAAFADSYAESIDPIDYDDIEKSALDYLADKSGRLFYDHFGPVLYNLISQNGKGFFGDSQLMDGVAERLKAVEKSVSEYQDAQRRKIERQKENDQAYIDIGPLPLETKKAIADKCRSLNCDRIIIATYSQDESDISTDYFHARSIRTVVIGFAAGKRENFKQLREAAWKFPPTKHMGPGLDRWKVYVAFAENCSSNFGHFYQGQKSPWHDELSPNQVFQTEDQAKAFIAQKGEPHQVKVGESIASFRWEISFESFEHRDNWSMGAGNYLGDSRHGTGWTIKSALVDHFGASENERIELLDIEHLPAKPAKVKPAKAKPVIVLDDETQITKQGYHYRTLQLQVAGTIANVSKVQPPGNRQPYYLVWTAKSRRGSAKTFWKIESIINGYRSSSMKLIAEHAGQVFDQ